MSSRALQIEKTAPQAAACYQVAGMALFIFMTASTPGPKCANIADVTTPISSRYIIADNAPQVLEQRAADVPALTRQEMAARQLAFQQAVPHPLTSLLDSDFISLG